MSGVPGGDRQVIQTLVLTGFLTWYAGPYVGQTRRCGGVYELDSTELWIAIDIDAYPAWRCNDQVRVTVGEDVLLLPLLDSGLLSRYCVRDGDTCTEIVADLPRGAFLWPGLSVYGAVENVTAGLRQVGAGDRTEDRQEVER